MNDMIDPKPYSVRIRGGRPNCSYARFATRDEADACARGLNFHGRRAYVDGPPDETGEPTVRATHTPGSHSSGTPDQRQEGAP